ncbi:MAG TPA: ABC transporter permease [Blastocatellia bacterium]|nr:ABC transporter permease [Blastocatellia bacterium]
MASLARRNLFHDRVRLAVTLTGIVFAVVLVTVQLGLFVGFATTTSNISDRSNADLWIAARGLRNFDQAAPFSERKLYQALATPGVARAEKYIVSFSRWKRPDGGEEGVGIVGFDLNAGMGGPWGLSSGSIDDLRAADTVIIDEIYREKLGIQATGQTVEINGHRARVVGFTRDIRSFTTNPRVFTSFKNAQNYARIAEDQTTFILVKAEQGADLQTLKNRLAERIEDIEVYTTAEFSRKTQVYWMFSTGAGIGILIAALMGLVVGVVVVAQTIYATTIDHLREYGTLKAMGASNGYIYRVIIKQALISAAIGYVLGMAVSVLVVRMSSSGGAAIKLPWEMAAGMLVLTFLMCAGASIVSINKVTRIDPAMVFKG